MAASTSPDGQGRREGNDRFAFRLWNISVGREWAWHISSIER